MLRGRSFAVACVLLGAMSICVAQETADIIVGGEVVARVREAASYDSVEHRAAAIDEKINQVLATTDDPGALEVSLEQVDGVWTILIEGNEIMAVHPAEAEANGLTPEMLGASWVRRFKDALPGATGAPVTVIDEGEVAADEGGEAEPVQPLVIADEPVISSPTTGDEPATSSPPPATAPPTAAETGDTGSAVQILEVPQGSETEPGEIVAGQGARLLILEAFNTSRELPEDDYLVRREAMANDLFDDLVQVLTGGQATGRIESGGTASPPTPPQPTPAPTTTPEPEPAETTTAPVTIDTGPQPPSTGPSTVGATPSLEMSDEARAKIEAKIPANNPSYANVVQKVAIKAKFRAVSGPYRDALSNDPATGAQAREVLTAARRAFNDGDFDTAERYLDTGLQILGVTQWENHIDAAMSDLGLGG